MLRIEYCVSDVVLIVTGLLMFLFLSLARLFFLSLAFLLGSFVGFAGFTFTFGLSTIVATFRDKTVFFLALFFSFADFTFTFGLSTIDAIFR